MSDKRAPKKSPAEKKAPIEKKSPAEKKAPEYGVAERLDMLLDTVCSTRGPLVQGTDKAGKKVQQDKYGATVPGPHGVWTRDVIGLICSAPTKFGLPKDLTALEAKTWLITMVEAGAIEAIVKRNQTNKKSGEAYDWLGYVISRKGHGVQTQEKVTEKRDRAIISSLPF